MQIVGWMFRKDAFVKMDLMCCMLDLKTLPQTNVFGSISKRGV